MSWYGTACVVDRGMVCHGMQIGSALANRSLEVALASAHSVVGKRGCNAARSLRSAPVAWEGSLMDLYFQVGRCEVVGR